MSQMKRKLNLMFNMVLRHFPTFHEYVKVKNKNWRRRHVLQVIKPGFICAEIGVWKGDFSVAIAKCKPARLHLIDPWLYLPEMGNRSYGKRGDNDQDKMDQIYNLVQKRFDGNEHVEIHRQTSGEAVAKFADSYFDFVYIDANHNYEFVRNDLEKYLPKVKREGFLVGDDYIFSRCPLGGPERAVTEMVDEGQVELLLVKNNQFFLRKI